MSRVIHAFIDDFNEHDLIKQKEYYVKLEKENLEFSNKVYDSYNDIIFKK